MASHHIGNCSPFTPSTHPCSWSFSFTGFSNIFPTSGHLEILPNPAVSLLPLPSPPGQSAGSLLIAPTPPILALSVPGGPLTLLVPLSPTIQMGAGRLRTPPGALTFPPRPRRSACSSFTSLPAHLPPVPPLSAFHLLQPPPPQRLREPGPRGLPVRGAPSLPVVVEAAA